MAGAKDSSGSASKGLDDNLMPMNSIFAILDDLALRALELGLRAYFEAMNGRHLTIATMCSGTESPIFALRGVSDSCCRAGETPVEIYHEFSAELEAFKQAFIERNFSPPLLFRDIVDFETQQYSQTAYGARAKLPPPGQVDLLIAGFACVDFSTLNSRRKGLNTGGIEEIDENKEGLSASDNDVETVAQASDGPSLAKKTSLDETRFAEHVSKVKQDDGESSVTFRAIANWARKHRPVLVILENIKNAPWVLIEEVFECIGYSTKHVDVDTKRYYLPHTRLRGYMVCIDNKTSDKAKASGMATAWAQLMHQFERPASSPVEDFLLPDSSPLHQAALAEPIQKSAIGDPIKTDTDWTLSRNRHQKVRCREELGNETPYTNCSKTGCTMPSYSDIPWGKCQPDRILDMLDILKLFDAKRDEDFEFKARYPDLSQNVDRMMNRANPGITGCLTPAGMGYSSIAGRQITGLEALVLQGFSPDHLHLTRESQRELQDLAGNAMSTTVAGAAILSALIVAKDVLAKSSARRPKTSISSAEDAMLPPSLIINGLKATKAEQRSSKDNTTRPPWFEQFKDTSAKQASWTLADICRLATATSQLCHCEGQDQFAKLTTCICQDCGAMACEDCKGIPPHNYVESQRSSERQNPHDFIGAIHRFLPPRIRVLAGSKPFHAAVSKSLELARHSYDRSVGRVGNLSTKSLKKFLEGIETAFAQEVRLASMQRSAQWRILYEAPSMRLEITIGESSVWWTYFMKLDNLLPVNSPIRALFQGPVARMTASALCPSGIFRGEWQVLLPLHQETRLSINGHGGHIESWKLELGLKNVDPSERYVNRCLEVSVAGTEGSQPLHALTGVYELLPACGTANRNLHIKRAPSLVASTFLFLDPNPYGLAANDGFVFSHDPRRLQHGEKRKIIAHIGATAVDFQPKTINSGKEQSSSSYQMGTTKWRPSSSSSSGETVISTTDIYSVRANLRLNIIPANDFSILTPCGAIQDFNFAALASLPCRDAFVDVVRCHVPKLKIERPPWSQNMACRVDERNDRVVKLDLMWLTISLRTLTEAPQRWTRLPHSMSQPCTVCAPQRPKIEWVEIPTERKKSKRQRADAETSIEFRFVPLENPARMVPFENSIKNRPSPFLITTQTEDQMGRSLTFLSIALNVPALAHRATGQLLARSSARSGGSVNLFWRIDTSFNKSSHKLLPFTLLSNVEDKPRQFKFSARDPKTRKCFKLRTDQARSLAWMLARDSSFATPFDEEIVEESICTNLGWRLEARAVRGSRVRGGIVADDVGFGKTVTMLALIKDSLAHAHKEAEGSVSDFIPIRATLIVTPHSLTPQWVDEIQKFWPSCKVLHYFDVRGLQQKTVRDFQDADVVVVSITAFLHQDYLNRLAALAALPVVPKLNGVREHEEWFLKATARLGSCTRYLRDAKKPATVSRFLEEEASNYQTDRGLQNPHASRRLKGQKFVDARYCKKFSSTPVPSNEQTSLTRKLLPVEGFEQIQEYSDLVHAVFHQFEFQRKVVDEQTYVDEAESKAIGSVRSRATWILSGTPLMRDFADVKRMASFLGLHLGIDDDTRGYIKDDNARLLRSAMTDFEKFQACQQTYSPDWHAHRHRLAQKFLNSFARKNRPEIPSIDQKSERLPIYLSRPHRVLNLELESQLACGDTKLSKKHFNAPNTLQADHQLMKLLGSSSTKLEAMAKSSTVLSLRAPSVEEKGLTVESIARAREEFCLAVKRALESALEKISQDTGSLNEDLRETMRLWIGYVKEGKYGERQTTEILIDLLEDYEKALADCWRPIQPTQRKAKPRSTAAQASAQASAQRDTKAGHRRLESNAKVGPFVHYKECSHTGNVVTNPAKLKDLRKAVNLLHPLSLDMVRGLRGLRYCRNAHKLQKALATDQAATAFLPLVQTDCQCRQSTVFTVRMCRECGHIVCEDCMPSRSGNTACVVKWCKGRWLASNIILPSDLRLSQALGGKQHNSKISSLLSLIQEHGERDQILVFVQYPEAAQSLCKGMIDAGVTYDYIKSVTSAPSILKRFKATKYGDRKWVQVLVMDPFQSSAAGHNLTNVNLVIFACPLLTGSKEEYDALYTQSIGRACRFGQEKKVRIYHLLSLGTADVNIAAVRKEADMVIEAGKLVYNHQARHLKEDLASRLCAYAFSAHGGSN